MAPVLRLTATLGLAVLLSACAGRAPISLDTAQLPQLPKHILLNDVPFHAQDAYQCGPASLAMVLNQRHIKVTPEELKEQIYLPERQGSLQIEIVAAARQYDLLVYPLEKKLLAILSEVAAGNPVLVMQNLAFNWYPQWHYAVVVGYDLPNQELIVHSGLNRAQREPFKVFLRTWDRAGRWARVTLPTNSLPATAQPLTYLSAASDLEQTGRLPGALQAYQRAATQWPEQPTAQLGIGNVLWAQNQRFAAIAQFQQLVNNFPDFQPGWTNLASALQTLDCPVAAQQATECSQQTSKAAACAQLHCPALP